MRRREFVGAGIAAVTGLQDITRRVLGERLKPRPRLALSAWADEYRYLSPESAAEPGRWRTARVPYLREIMDTITDAQVERVVLQKGAQLGFTEGVVGNAVGYYIHQDPAPILVVQPSVDPMAKAWSKDRLAPMVRDTPCLRVLVSDPRSRDSANTTLHKVFPGGHITCVGANSAAGLATRPIRILLFDEVDRYPPSAGTEGDPVDLGVKRSVTYWNRKIVLGSTPGHEETSRIAPAFGESDQRYYFVPCPHCERMQWLRWRDKAKQYRLIFQRTPDGDVVPGSAHYQCEHCDELIEESHKGWMLARGEWRARYPGRPVVGFHLSQLYSPWVSWEEIAQEFVDAQGNPERMKVWVNTVLAETWQGQGERIEQGSLLSRREPYPAELPAGVGLLTAAIDVQVDRLELAVKGWGAGQESWLIAHHRIPGAPHDLETWKRAEVLITKAYRHELGAALHVSACAVDSGYETDAVYAFVRPRQRRRFFAVKGISERGRPILGRPAKRPNRAGVRVWPIGTDTAKDVVFGRLRLTDPGPGYMHFPPPQVDGADDDYLTQFTHERRTVRYVKGFPVRVYEPVRKSAAVEAIDLEVYNLAALHFLGPAVTEYLETWVKRAQDAGRRSDGEVDSASRPIPEPSAPDPRPSRRKRTGGNWATDWKR